MAAKVKGGTTTYKHSPGETHILVAPEECEEMITFFNITGCMYYVDADGENIGYEDVFTKIDLRRKHYSELAWRPNR